jgi:hypothetical protein
LNDDLLTPKFQAQSDQNCTTVRQAYPNYIHDEPCPAS